MDRPKLPYDQVPKIARWRADCRSRAFLCRWSKRVAAGVFTTTRLIPKLLLHGSKLLIYAETGFGDDPDQVPKVIGGVFLDVGLLRPSHVVRPEQAFEDYRKLDAGTGIGRAELFPHRHVEHSTQYAAFLVHRGWLDGPKFSDDRLAANFLLLLEPTPQMHLDFGCINVCELGRPNTGLNDFNAFSLASSVACAPIGGLE
jgi:hypothetical protein